MNKESVISELQKSMTVLRATWKVKSISLFGSMAKNSSSSASDIDIIVDFDDGADLFDLMGVGNYLEEKLGKKVDVVSRNGLRKELRDEIEKEAILI